ncbi:MAG: hypothetical protein GMKNLPBB_01681 [Myxococcota bacterium]|nr:hypothetical protein [Myxococcota bacterium]
MVRQKKMGLQQEEASQNHKRPGPRKTIALGLRLRRNRNLPSRRAKTRLHLVQQVSGGLGIVTAIHQFLNQRGAAPPGQQTISKMFQQIIAGNALTQCNLLIRRTRRAE